VYDDSIYVTQLQGSSSTNKTKTTLDIPMLTATTSSSDTPPLSVIDTIADSWWTTTLHTLRAQLPTTWRKDVDDSPSDSDHTDHERESSNTPSVVGAKKQQEPEPITTTVLQVHKLFLKLPSGPLPPVAQRLDGGWPVEVTEHSRLVFETPNNAVNEDNNNRKKTQLLHEEERPLTAHLTYTAQSLLDARHDVHPHTDVQSVRALLRYQQTGAAPAAPTTSGGANA